MRLLKNMAEKQEPKITMDQGAFIPMKSLNRGSQEPPELNVAMGDKIAIPLYSETVQSAIIIIIMWTQGNEFKELGRCSKATSTPSHISAYAVMYGHNINEGPNGKRRC